MILTSSSPVNIQTHELPNTINDPLSEHWYKIWDGREIGIWCDTFITNLGALLSEKGIAYYPTAIILFKKHRELIKMLNNFNEI